MERHEVLAMMTALKLAGMRAAYDDILADGLKRRHPVQQIIGTLLQVEIADKTARSIKYQMASARLPTAKELADLGVQLVDLRFTIHDSLLGAIGKHRAQTIQRLTLPGAHLVRMHLVPRRVRRENDSLYRFLLRLTLDRPITP